MAAPGLSISGCSDSDEELEQPATQTSPAMASDHISQGEAISVEHQAIPVNKHFSGQTAFQTS